MNVLDRILNQNQSGRPAQAVGQFRTHLNCYVEQLNKHVAGSGIIDDVVKRLAESEIKYLFLLKLGSLFDTVRLKIEHPRSFVNLLFL